MSAEGPKYWKEHSLIRRQLTIGAFINDSQL